MDINGDGAHEAPPFAFFSGRLLGGFWTSQIPLTMQGLISILAAASIAAASVLADCPDYSDYSKAYHGPFSEGRYKLSYQRPDPACRTFNSSAVEDTITSMKSVIKDPDLYRIFQNSFPNSLDTAVKWKGFAINNAAEELTFLVARTQLLMLWYL